MGTSLGATWRFRLFKSLFNTDAYFTLLPLSGGFKMKSTITSIHFIMSSLLILFALFGVAPCTAEVVLEIGPDLAVTQGAQWRIVGQDTWYDPNVPVDLPPGMQTIEYKNLSDWAETL